MKTGSLAIAAALLASPAAAQKTAPIVGTYTVEGACPGQQGAYRGVLTVTRAGSMYGLRWVIAGDVSTGRAIEQDGRLAISYTLGGQGGLMMTRPTDTGWEGRWAMYNSTTVCTERWQRR